MPKSKIEEPWNKARPCFYPDVKTLELAQIIASVEKKKHPNSHKFQIYRKGDLLALSEDLEDLKKTDAEKYKGFCLD